MTTSSDFNMLRLEAPRDLFKITDGTPRLKQAVEITNPAVWVRTLVYQQQQAESNLQRLTELCGDAYDRTDRQKWEIEQAYQTLAEGTRYVYDRVNANKKIAKEWIRSELPKRRTRTNLSPEMSGRPSSNRPTRPTSNKYVRPLS